MQAAPKGALPVVLAYLSWLLSIAACVMTLFQFQSALNVVGVALGANRYALRLGNQVALLVGGLIAFIYAMFLEGYYRQGARRGVLGRRFVKTLIVPLGVIVLSLALVEIAIRVLR